MQTPRVTTIQVRVDCNGCAQKIKKALNGINGRYINLTWFSFLTTHQQHQPTILWTCCFAGIHDLLVDFDRQRLTVIGWADPENIVKAVKKKAKKNATIICSNIELTPSSKDSKPTKQKPKENILAPQAQGTSFPELILEATPSSPTPTWHNARQHWQNNIGTENVEKAHMSHHHQPNYVNRIGSRNNYVDHRDRLYHNDPVFLQEPSKIQPLNVIHSYNTHMPSSHITEYECVRSPSWHTHYNHIEHYNGDYNNNNVDIAAMFSDDNPNACTIV